MHLQPPIVQLDDQLPAPSSVSRAPRLPSLSLLLLLSLSPTDALAATWLVDPSGFGDALDITSAITLAAPGDVIEVAPGTYPEVVDPQGKELTVRSLAGPSQTVISPAASTCVQFVNGETATVLAGFTITGCTLRGVSVAASSPTLRDLIITANGGAGVGGGLLIDGGSPVLERVLLSQNTATFGGGLAITGDSSVLVTRLTITGNTATTDGGGLWAQAPIPPNLSSPPNDWTPQDISLIWRGGSLSNNAAGNEGGGLYALTASVELSGVTVDANTASTGGGGIRLLGGALSTDFVRFAGNTAPAGSAVRATDATTVLGPYCSGPFQPPCLPSSSFLRTRFASNGGASGTNAAVQLAGDAIVIDCEVVDHPDVSAFGDSALHYASLTRPPGTGSSGDQQATLHIERTRFLNNEVALSGPWGWEADDLVLDSTFFANTQAIHGAAGLTLIGGAVSGSALPPFNVFETAAVSANTTWQPSTVHDVLFVDNAGGALQIAGETSSIDACIFAGNSPALGLGPQPTSVFGNTFVGNSGALDATSPSGVVAGNLFTYTVGQAVTAPTSSLTENVDYGNALATYPSPGPDASQGNQTLAPLYLAWSDDGDWTNDDFRLRVTSPARDQWISAGLDRDGTPADPGAYGGLLPHTHDLDGDGVSRLAGDCMDADPDIAPGAPERSNGLDDDCDGEADEGIPDLDGDGFPASALLPWYAADCDDTQPAVHPDSPDLCDGLDNDCDGLVDEEWDADGDGVSPCAGDCDDDDPSRWPGALEPLDGLDNDCDGQIDEPEDIDGDLITTAGGDCDDTLTQVWPGAPEQPDGLDNDCDGLVDEGLDVDGDGMATDEGDCDDFDPAVSPLLPETCDGLDNDCDGALGDDEQDGDGDGLTACDGDCDGADPTVLPGAPELCDGVDTDCDGVADEDFDADGDGWTTCAGDCDDASPAINPDYSELCDGQDQDCDGLVDEDFDSDGDGLSTCGGDCDDSTVAVGSSSEQCDGLDNDCDGAIDEDFDLDADGWSPCPGPEPDCDDLDGTTHPGAPELCDGVDNDCDASVDELPDADGDGYSPCEGDCDDDDPAVSPGEPEVACDGADENCDGAVDEPFDVDADGWTSCEGDCDDARPGVSPAGTESCDGLDNDCDGLVDEGHDTDGDGATWCGGDCDDGDASVGPGSQERCDGADDDCDGVVDEGFDVDGDGVSPCAGDCDDGDPQVAPGVPELCDGLDQDCDGAIDDGLDEDGDGFTPCAGDEDDADSSVFPGAGASSTPPATAPGGASCSTTPNGHLSPLALLVLLALVCRRHRRGYALLALLTLALATALGTPGTAVATTWTVFPASSGANRCSLCTANLGAVGDFDTITAALQAASSGDTIEVSSCYCGSDVLDPGARDLSIVAMGTYGFEVGGVAVGPGGSLVVHTAVVDGDIDVADGTLLLLGVDQGNPSSTCAVSGASVVTALDSDLNSVHVTDGDVSLLGGTLRAPPGMAPLQVDGGVVLLDAVESVQQRQTTGLRSPVASGPVVLTDGSIEAVGLSWVPRQNGIYVTTPLPPTAGGAFFEVSGGLLELLAPDFEPTAGPIVLASGGTVSWIGGRVAGAVTPADAGVISLPPGSTAFVSAEDVLFDGTSSLASGGVAFVSGGTLLLDTPTIEGTSANVGGAVAVDGGALVWEGGLAAGTSANQGGLVAVTGGAASLTNVGVTASSALQGGAFYITDGQLDLSFCTVLGSSAAISGDHLQADGGAWTAQHTALAFPNGAVGIEGGTPASSFDWNFVTGDPGVVSWNADASTGNDDLWPALSSGLRDAGDPALLDADGSRADIGISGGLGAAPADLDGDGWSQALDCDDLAPSSHPGAVELCDGRDNDCDGAIDEGLDFDGDGVTPCAGDCNDAVGSIAPGSSELCDGLDNDCDGAVDEGFDGDSDGVTSCGGDCDDDDPSRSPEVLEACDGYDNDCDGLTDEDFDGDGDGVGDCFDCDDGDAGVAPGALELCDGVDQDCDGLIDDGFDLDGDGWTTCAGDCQDGAPSVSPGGAEICDGLDNDCDGLTDLGCPPPGDDDDAADDDDLVDDDDSADDDDFADDDDTTDDDDSTAPVCVPEVCDGLDNDCDGFTDEDWDRDGDLFADCGAGSTNPGGALRDCRDGDPTAFPGAPELCNGLDDDCDGEVDESFECAAQAPETSSGCDQSGGSPSPVAWLLLLALVRRRRASRCLGVGLLAVLAAPLGASAATWTVDAAGSGDFVDISVALAAATSGDRVEVMAGSYLGPVDFAGKDVALVSLSGAGVTSLSSTSGRAVLVVSGETASLEGFTLSGASGCVQLVGANLTLTDNVFDGCGSAPIQGAAVLASAGSTLVSTGNLVQGCVSARGAVLLQGASSWFSTADTFSGNTASQQGGAFAIDASDANLDAPVLTANQSGAVGGAGACISCSLSMTNPVATSNSAPDRGGALFVDGGDLVISGGSFVDNGQSSPPATTEGGAIWAGPSSDVQVGGSLFDGNEALSGAAIGTTEDTTLGVYGCTFTDNVGPRHDVAIGLPATGSSSLPTAQATLVNSAFTSATSTGVGVPFTAGADADQVLVEQCSFGGLPSPVVSLPGYSVTGLMSFAGATTTLVGCEFGAFLDVRGMNRQYYPSVVLGSMEVLGCTFLGSAGLSHPGELLVQGTTFIDPTQFRGAIDARGLYASTTVRNVDIFGGSYGNYGLSVQSTALVENALVVDVQQGVASAGSGAATVRYSDFWSVANPPPGTNNVQLDPLVVSWSDDGDPTNDDLTRQPGTPLVDLGNPTIQDIDGSISDIGALGGPDVLGDADGDGYSARSGDCDDADPLRFPFAPELCDGTDNDCDGLTDEDSDLDADGASSCAGDCDDTDPLVFPGAVEVCDGDDEDCDGLIDQGFDSDADGVTSCAGDCVDGDASVFPGAVETCDGLDNDCDGLADEGFDADLDGVSSCAGDCDDTNPSASPALGEVCDGQDNDCDGLADEGLDQDGDGASPCEGDCDDTEPAVHAAALELCDGLDNDCDGALDELPDADGDGASPCDGDCDDAEPAVSAGFDEVCDGLDNDCDGAVDAGVDADGDGAERCPQTGDPDCDDDHALSAPHLEEVCDGVDNDCDALIDEGMDADGDGALPCAGDCDDEDPAVAVGQTEVCDERDNDCDGLVDEGCSGAGGPSADDDDSAQDDDDSPEGEPSSPSPGDEGRDGLPGDDCACTTSPAPQPGWLHALALLALLGARRRRATPLLPALVLSLGLASAPTPAIAATWTVAPGGAGDFTALQPAIDAASSGDTVLVQPGTYLGGFDLVGKQLVIESLAGPATTVLDGALLGQPTITAISGEPLGTTLVGFTITGGAPGVLVGVGSSLTLDSCLIDGNAALDGGGVHCSGGAVELLGGAVSDNVAALLGGGLLLDDCAASLSGVLLTSNSAREGGGLAALGTTSLLWDSGEASWNTATQLGGAALLFAQSVDWSGTVVSDNTAVWGGGVALSGSSSATAELASLTFTRNLATASGGGLYVDTPSSAAEVHNCVVDGNEASHGGGLYLAGSGVALHFNDLLANDATVAGAALYVTGASPYPSIRNNLVAFNSGSAGVAAPADLPIDFAYNDVYGHAAGPYQGLPNLTGVAGNVAAQPWLTAWSADADPTNDSLYPLPPSALRDAADPALSDPDGTRADIGVFGGPDSLDLDDDGDGANTSSGDCDDTDPAIGPTAADDQCDGVDDDCDGVPDGGLDTDGDGFSACSGPPPAGDCDDTDAAIHPAAQDLCDGIDNDCDGVTDPSMDADGDGVSTCAGDCDDLDPTQLPGAPETCNGQDDDCDLLVDEGFDGDGDGYSSCSAGAVDCDDGNASVYPGAYELCDGIDNDCDGGTDESPDSDGDGFTICDGDCDDWNALANPGVLEVCDGIDNDCSGGADDGLALDLDGDGFTPIGTCGTSPTDCDDSDPLVNPLAADVCDGLDNDCDGVIDGVYDQDQDGSSVCAGDCNDLNASVSPLATELCDGIDNDCDGDIDEDADLDGDGQTNCGGDCDDADPLVFFGGVEICNGRDDDCDGASDEGMDADGDGWGACAGGDCNDLASWAWPGAAELCNTLDDDCDGLVDEDFDGDGDGATTCAGECDDSNPGVFPGAAEVCNLLDDDCDGTVDEGSDLDGDGATTCGPDGIPGTPDDDCDDTNAQVSPGPLDWCDGVDNDCDGSIDENSDYDGDGYSPCQGDCNDTQATWSPVGIEICDGWDQDCDGVADEDFDSDGDGWAPCGPTPDCDDARPDAYPGAVELCNQLDDDCDGLIDDAQGGDGDGDGHASCAGVDCNEADPTIHADAEEICDGIDNDCDALTDEGFDGDADGWPSCAPTGAEQVDCDDEDDAVFPGAWERCDGRDSDCDGEVDWRDGDGDGWSACPGLEPGPYDCDDEDPEIAPFAVESCDGLDNDCDGRSDEDFDPDGDRVTDCMGDCDSSTAAVSPDAREVCDHLDNDCDGQVDEEDDADGDGFSICDSPPDCDDSDPTRYPGAPEPADGIDHDCDAAAQGSGCTVGGAAPSTARPWLSLLVVLLAFTRTRRTRPSLGDR